MGKNQARTVSDKVFINHFFKSVGKSKKVFSVFKKIKKYFY